MMDPREGWVPILDGELLRRARESVFEIAEGLSGERLEHADYANGEAGAGLFFAHLAQMTQEERFFRIAAERLEAAVDQGPEEDAGVGFMHGHAGIAWACCMVTALLGEQADGETTAELDDFLRELLALDPWPGTYDLTSGLCGIGVYGLDHPDRRIRRDLVRGVVDRLAGWAEPWGEGVTWRTLERDATVQGVRLGGDYIDLGVAHGVGGVLGFLGRAARDLEPDPRATVLMAPAIAGLLTAARWSHPESVFPGLTRIDAPGDGKGCRAAWCYGDPGLACVLLAAGGPSPDGLWTKAAHDLLVRTMKRSTEETGVVDATVCHGTAGLAHLFNRAFQATRRPSFALAAQRWFAATLEMRVPGARFGGFRNWWPEVGEWHSDGGLLTGSAGIGLALLAATSDVEPTWDRPLLIG